MVIFLILVILLGLTAAIVAIATDDDMEDR